MYIDERQTVHTTNQKKKKEREKKNCLFIYQQIKQTFLKQTNHFAEILTIKCQ